MHWFREGYRAGVAAEQGRAGRARRKGAERAIADDLRAVIHILAIALLEDAHQRASSAAVARERRKRKGEL